MEAQLNIERTELSTLQSSKEEMAETVANLSTIMGSLEDELELAEQDKARLRTENESLNAEVDSLRARLESATEGTMSALRQVEDTSRALERQQRNFRTLEERFNRTNESIEALEADNTRLRTIVRRLGLNPDAQPRNLPEERPAQTQPQRDPPAASQSPEQNSQNAPAEEENAVQPVEEVQGAEETEEQSPGEGRRWQMPDIFE